MESKKKHTIPDSLIIKIQDRLSRGKQVRRALPLEGRLHIDRTLPFLFVYRRPHNNSDKGTERLVKGEASYLIISDDPQIKSSLNKLLRIIVQTLYKEFKAFLIIEINSNQSNFQNDKTDKNIVNPAFNICKLLFPIFI